MLSIDILSVIYKKHIHLNLLKMGMKVFILSDKELMLVQAIGELEEIYLALVWLSTDSKLRLSSRNSSIFTLCTHTTYSVHVTSYQLFVFGRGHPTQENEKL